MAMEALTNLTTNIPDWQKRLDDLSTQIDRRQVELAALAEGSPKEAEARSLRNKGSTESLKPQDDGPLHFCYPEDEPPMHPHHVRKSSLPCQNGPRQPSPPSPAAEARMGLCKPMIDTKTAAHSRAGVPVKKRIRTASVASADGPRPTYRTRSMIIVYYDSYVQGFFDDLVRFISSSRNLMRKAKMAAKVAQIKRLAEMEMPDDENASGDDRGSTEALPSLRYISSRRFGPAAMRFGPPGMNQPPDVYDDLDKGLEFVQSTCEHGAHQFLREANCHDEIKKIQQRLAEVLELASKEMERVEREEPELAKEPGDMGKVRTIRPISVSRNLVPNRKDEHPVKDECLAVDDAPAKLEVADEAAAKIPVVHIMDQIEVDTDANNEDIMDPQAMLRRLQYRSTRAKEMRTIAN